MPGRRRSLSRYALNAAAEGINTMPPRGSGYTPPVAVARALLPSLGVWPPSQSTRDAVVRRLVQRLAGPSMFSQRYGAVSEPEAKRTAATIEAEAFAAASESAAGATLASDAERFEVFRAYSREIGRRLLGVAESRAASGAAPALGAVQEPGDSSATAPPPAQAVASEE